jgi:hypothetical protein
MANDRLCLPCAKCASGLNEVISRPQERAKHMTEGFLFYWCRHNLVHVCWAEDGGHTSLQECMSERHGEMINGAYLAAGNYHRKHLAQLLSHELARSIHAVSSDAKPNAIDDSIHKS